jgi:hypothetical protein
MRFNSGRKGFPTRKSNLANLKTSNIKFIPIRPKSATLKYKMTALMESWKVGLAKLNNGRVDTLKSKLKWTNCHTSKKIKKTLKTDIIAR